jgi:hypothetical protein
MRSCRHNLAEDSRLPASGVEVAMQKMRSLVSALVVAGAVALPGSASAVGDATYSLASYRAMAEATASPAERIMAVYMASLERVSMLERLREKYPSLVW